MAEGFSPSGFSPSGFSPSTDFYKAINVSRNASQEEIRKTLNSLSKQVHPDKTRTTATEGLMKELNKIRDVLLDAVEKRKYDEELLSRKAEPDVPLFMKENRGSILLPPSMLTCDYSYRDNYYG